MLKNQFNIKIETINQVPRYDLYYFLKCQKTNLTQKFKLINKILRYDLYYSITHLLK